jgi:hypothetical protein
MMSRKYVLIPVLVALVVLAVSLYPTANVTQRASAAPRAALVTKYLMIPAAAFNPGSDGSAYYNGGFSVRLDTGASTFVAPVYLPTGARIRMIKFFAFDGNTNHDLCATLYESQPKIGWRSKLKEVCTSGIELHQQPQKYLSYYVKWYYGYFISLYYPASLDLTTFSVMLKYTIRQ